MGNKNKSVWPQVPWGWVLVSVYCTALICVGLSQLTSQETAATFVKDYQTLIAGVATVAALFIAAKQLKRQADRDVIDAQRHHQNELDALKELDKAAARLATEANQRPNHFDPALPYDRPRWERLRQQANVSISGSVSSVMKEVEAYNVLFAKADEPSFQLVFNASPTYVGQYQTERTRVYFACMLLLAAVQERRNSVLGEIAAAI